MTESIMTLEKFLFSENKPEFIGKMISGTDNFYYFSLIHALNTYGVDLPKNHLEDLEKYKKMNSNRAKNIVLRYNFMQLTKSDKSETERKAILREINKHTLHYNFDFDEPKTLRTTTINVTSTENETILSPKTIDWKGKLEEAYNDINVFHSLENAAFTYLDTDKLVKGDPDVISSVVNGGNISECLNFEKLLKVYIKNNKKQNQGFQLNEGIYTRMTLEQMRKLGELLPEHHKQFDFVKNLFIKEFEVNQQEDEIFGTFEEKIQYRSKLLKIYEWTKNLPQKFDFFSVQFLFEILQVGLEINEYNFDLFLEYLRNPKKPYSAVNDTHRTKITKRKDRSDYEYKSQLSNPVSDDKLIDLYLEAYFKQKNKIEPFDEVLKIDYLKTLFYKIRLYEGDQLENISELLPSNVLSAIQNEKMINICRFNKEFFSENEEVKLYVEIKNIPSLTIKIFELSAEDYYLTKKEEITGNINIDGLIANEEISIEFKESSQRKVIKEFKFDEITKKKQGVYVIEFVGFGYSSRAVIKKGKLLLIEKVSLAGQIFTILDENLEICKTTKRSGLWVKKNFHEANQEGQVILPFSTTEEKTQVIIVHNEFACLTNINLVKEEYDFRCTFLYKDESFLMGNKLKLLIQPKLFLKKQPVNLDIIKDPTVTIETRTENNIPSTLVFDKVKFDYKEDLEIEFPIPSNLKEIKVEVNGKIKLMINKEDLVVFQKHLIKINNSVSSNRFCRLYLKYTQKGYEIMVLGKNGEPKQNIIVNLGFHNKYLNTPINLQLKSNPEGRVVLGKLADIYRITASIREKGDIEAECAEWNISNQKKANYPRELNCCEGDNIEIPYLSSELNRHKVSFFKTTDSSVYLEKFLEVIKVAKNKLVISGIKAGTYYLGLKDEQVIIKIQVNKGKYWKNTNLMVMKDYLSYVNNSIPKLFIQDVERKQENNQEKLGFSIYSDDMKSTRVHILAYQFINKDVDCYCKAIENNMEETQIKIIPNVESRNHYLSNRTLNDEYCYVLNRKKESKHIGNTLEKPQILLKRTFVRETNIKLENLEEGATFKENLLLEEKKQAREKFLQKKEQKMLALTNNNADFSDVNSFLNFLQHPCMVLSNIKPDSHGRIEVNIDFGKYSTFEIIAININNVVHEIIPLENKEIQSKDLRQENNTTKSKKFYSTFRNTSTFLKGEKFIIDDITSTEFRIVDSLTKVFNLQKEFIKAGKYPSESEKMQYQEWNFLMQWPNLSIEEKQRSYDEFASHELNIFLYFKDQAFFNNFVRPFMQNKIEKDFIDFFLLNDIESIKEYYQLQKFDTLNTLEKILLLIHFVQIKKPNEAKNIASYLENQAKSQKQDPNLTKQLFDIILGSKDQSNISPHAQSNLAAVLKKPIPVTQALNAYMSNASRGASHQMRGRGKGGAKKVACRKRKTSAQNISDSSDSDSKSGSVLSESEMMMDEDERALSICEMNKSDRSGSRSRSRSVSLQRSDDGRDRKKEKKTMRKDIFENDYEEDYENKRNKYLEVYTKPETTKEYAERKYLENYPDTLRIVPNNLFWVELAEHIVSKGVNAPFLSPKFIYSASSHVSMLATLAFLSLPFESTEHSYGLVEGKKMEIGLTSNSVIFHKEVKESEARLISDILITQRFYDPKDKYCISEDNSQVQFLKPVEEFIIDKVYECEVVVTNVSISPQEFQVLYEIPEGSIPTKSNEYLKSTNMVLASYQSQIISYSFYFPQSGKFSVYPANISQNGRVIAIANGMNFEVNNERVSKKLDTLDQILNHGSKEDILNFVATKNILNPNIFKFRDIYYLLKEKEFFLKYLNILRERKIYDHLTWAFSLYHADLPSLKEFMNVPAVLNVLKGFIRYFSNDLLTIKNIQLLEYYPLINPRTHTFAKDKSNILNQELKNQYKEFLEHIVEVSKPSAEDLLGFVYYLLLQERIDEALKVFTKINPEEVLKKKDKSQLQYDYFSAYLDFYTGEPEFKIARKNCDKYLDYPILSWRNMFYEIANQLAEYDGEELVDETTGSQDKKLTEKQKNVIAAKKQETLAAELQKNELVVSFQNCKEIVVNYYLIDLELLFSRNPFLLQGTDEFGFVLPNFSEKFEVQFSQETQNKTILIPEKLKKNNLSIQIKGSSKIVTLTYFSSFLNIQIIENCAQIKVTNLEQKPLSKIYVKAFSKMKSGKVNFYKDGYTDLRGRFDYASLNTDKLGEVENFALFVMSEELGSVIVEAKPPSDLGKMVVEVELKSNKMGQMAQLRHTEKVTRYLSDLKEMKEK